MEKPKKIYDINIEPAVDNFSTIKMALRGASGSGKTYSALQIAHGLANDWSKILVIDTEHSAGLYKKIGNFSKITISAPYLTEKFLQAFEKAIAAGFKVIIFDSMSHWWSGPGGILDVNAYIEETFYKGNSFRAWNKTNKEHYNPLLNRLIFQDEAHIIFTMRTKVKYVVTTENNKQKIQKIGMREDMRDGFDYELSLVLDIDQNHIATPLKDRTRIFDGKSFLIDETVGTQILDWIDNVSDPKATKHIIETHTPTPTPEVKPTPTPEPAPQPKPQPQQPAVNKLPTLKDVPANSQKKAAQNVGKNVEIDKLIVEIEYYMPIMEKYNKKYYDRFCEVIRARDEANLKSAISFLNTEKPKLKEYLDGIVMDFVEELKAMPDLKQKTMAMQYASKIVKDHHVFQTYQSILALSGGKK